MLLSTLTGEYYDESDSIRVVNPRQAAFYWGKCGVKPLSIYPGTDFKSGADILVFVFSKSKTKDIYQEWLKTKPE